MTPTNATNGTLATPSPPSPVWDRDGVRVYHGDALEVLPGLVGEEIAAVVTDPPYGTKVDRDGYGRRQIYQGKQHIEGDADLKAMTGALSASFDILERDAWVVTFCSPKRHRDALDAVSEAGFTVVGEAVWDKEQPGLGAGIRYQHETILLCQKGKVAGRAPMFSVLRGKVLRADRVGGHPHEKPLSVVSKLVRYCSRPGDLILDPFAGSGTTGVAALKTGRRCILIESDARYIPTITRRLADASTPLFDALDADTGPEVAR